MRLIYRAQLIDEETQEVLAGVEGFTTDLLVEKLYKLEVVRARLLKSDCMCSEEGCDLTLERNSDGTFNCPLHKQDMDMNEEKSSACCFWPIENGFCKKCGENA